MAVDPKHRATKADNTIPLSFDDLVRGVLFTDPKTLPTTMKASRKKAAKKKAKSKRAKQS